MITENNAATGLKEEETNLLDKRQCLWHLCSWGFLVLVVKVEVLSYLMQKNDSHSMERMLMVVVHEDGKTL